MRLGKQFGKILVSPLIKQDTDKTRPDTGHKSFAVFVSARQKKVVTNPRTDGRMDTPSYRVVAHD